MDRLAEYASLEREVLAQPCGDVLDDRVRHQVRVELELGRNPEQTRPVRLDPKPDRGITCLADCLDEIGIKLAAFIYGGALRPGHGQVDSAAFSGKGPCG